MISSMSILGADFNSSSGPNMFSKNLANQFKERGIKIYSSHAYDTDRNLVIIQYPDMLIKDFGKTFQRLDGLWLNINTNWKQMNEPIKAIYDKAKGIIFQSEFSRDFVFSFFGEHKNFRIIRNGYKLDEYETYTAINNKQDTIHKYCLTDYDIIFSTAASWRPHKRLKDIISIFQILKENLNCCLLVAGNDAKKYAQGSNVNDVIFVGQLSEVDLATMWMISHASFCITRGDNCPNVSVQSLYFGTPVICTNVGGTKEIVKDRGLILNHDPVWDFAPHDHLNPPQLDIDICAEEILNSKIYNKRVSCVDLDMKNTAEQYLDFMKKI